MPGVQSTPMGRPTQTKAGVGGDGDSGGGEWSGVEAEASGPPAAHRDVVRHISVEASKVERRQRWGEPEFLRDVHKHVKNAREQLTPDDDPDRKGKGKWAGVSVRAGWGCQLGRRGCHEFNARIQRSRLPVPARTIRHIGSYGDWHDTLNNRFRCDEPSVMGFVALSQLNPKGYEQSGGRGGGGC